MINKPRRVVTIELRRMIHSIVADATKYILLDRQWVETHGYNHPIATRSKNLMSVQNQIETYIASHPEPKRNDLRLLHERILQISPGCKVWFLDGKNDEGKIVSNPNIGYGSRPHKYADGTLREFYQIGMSANKTGISIYILGIEDKKYLAETYAKELDKASVTGYCIRFKTLRDINADVLDVAIRFGFENQNDKAS